MIVRYVYVMEIMDVMNVNALWSVPIAFYQPFTQIVLKCGIQLTPYPYRSLCASICIFLTLNHHSDSNSNLKNVLTEDEIFSIKYKIKCKRRLTSVFKYRVSPQKMSVFEMGEVRVFSNTPSCPMDKINRNWHLLDSTKENLGVMEPKNSPP